MEFLYVDFLYPKGHVRQNSYYISILSKIGKVYVLSPKNRYNDLPSNVVLIENNIFSIKNGKLSNRVSALINMIYSAFFDHKLSPDYIFISSYETIIFAIGRLFFRKQNRLYILHHFNIDELENRIKHGFFKTYMNKVNHVVFEDFIRHHILQKFNLEDNRVYMLPHQLNENHTLCNKKIYKCVGLSFSNDENIISQIIYKEQEESIFKNAQCRVVLKSQNIEFDNGYLKVIRGYIDDDSFNKYIDECSCIYMPFPQSFKYRMSGTLVDALSNNKILLGSNIPVMEYYSSMYPNICKIINTVDDFFKEILNIETTPNKKQLKDFEQFRCDHSNAAIDEAFRKMFHIC